MSVSPTPCGHWIGGERRLCLATDHVRPYLSGPRCPAHTPAALARQPEPPSDPLTAEAPMPDPAPMLAAALALAAEGYPVFFLGRTKRPVANCPTCPKAETDPGHDPEACPCLTCHGFYAATRDPDRIHAMHEAVPYGMLAIRTGTAADLAVIDVDPRNDGHVLTDLMPPTRCVRTGSDGWHLYYRHPGGTLAKDLNKRGHPGIDIKADGGYIVAPPSIHPGTRRPYRRIGDRPVIEMPPPLVELCRPVERRDVPAATVTRLTGGRGISNPAALLQALLDSVADAKDGARRTTLYGAAMGVARMVAAGALTAADGYQALYDAGVRAQQTHRDIHAAITGGFRAESVATEGIAA